MAENLQEKLERIAIGYYVGRDGTCAEAMLKAGAETLRIQSPVIPDIAIGLAGGVGREGSVCGLVTGSALVISLAVHGIIHDYRAKKSLILDTTGEFVDAFLKQAGSYHCRDICGVELKTEGGSRQFTLDTKKERCVPKLKIACKLLAGILQSYDTE